MQDLAQVYARSLFEVASEHGNLESVREQLAQVATALDENQDLRTFFLSPFFSTEERKRVLATTFEGAEAVLINFLELLIEKHRLAVVKRISQRFDSLWREANRLLSVELTSATPLDPETAQMVGNKIGESTDRKVELSTKVDPTILGGVVLRVGNAILDASVKHRLEKFRKAVAKA